MIIYIFLTLVDLVAFAAKETNDVSISMLTKRLTDDVSIHMLTKRLTRDRRSRFAAYVL